MLNSWQSFLTTPLWLAYFAILEITSWGQTSEVSPCIIISQEQATKDQSGYQSCATAHEAVFRLVRFIYANASHDNVVAFGTVVIALFTLTLWWSTSKLWKAGEKHSERELRAYVWVKAIGLHDLEVGKLPYVIVEIRNAGKTPAYNATVTSGCIIFPAELPPDTPFPFTGEQIGSASKMIIYQGAEPPFLSKAPLRASITMPQAVVDTLIEGKEARLFVFVLVKYTDAFGTDRETRFCNGIEIGASIGNSGNIAFFHTEQHNTAT